MIMIDITRHEYEQLVKDSLMLERLRVNGVGDWEQYTQSLKDYLDIERAVVAKAMAKIKP